MTTKEKIRFLIIRSIGNFLVLFAIFGVLATFGPALYYEAQYRLMQIRGVRFSISNAQISSPQKIKPSVGFADVLSGPKEQILAPIDPVFNIIIPKIGANARIFPNIDPSSSSIFLPILQQGVAHAAGTVFPGQAGNIYLFAHSTDNFWDVGRYNAIFYLLKDLSVGDDVVIFYQSVRHNYKVTKMGTTNPQEVSYLTNAQAGKATSAQGFGEPKEVLILQTCWPPGTTWQRLLVFAEPKQ